MTLKFFVFQHFVYILAILKSASTDLCQIQLYYTNFITLTYLEFFFKYFMLKFVRLDSYWSTTQFNVSHTLYIDKFFLADLKQMFFGKRL